MTKTVRNFLALSFLLTASTPGLAETASTGEANLSLKITELTPRSRLDPCLTIVDRTP